MSIAVCPFEKWMRILYQYIIRGASENFAHSRGDGETQMTCGAFAA
jgi:hypothetical protein